MTTIPMGQRKRYQTLTAAYERLQVKALLTARKPAKRAA